MTETAPTETISISSLLTTVTRREKGDLSPTAAVSGPPRGERAPRARRKRRPAECRIKFCKVASRGRALWGSMRVVARTGPGAFRQGRRAPQRRGVKVQQRAGQRVHICICTFGTGAPGGSRTALFCAGLFLRVQRKSHGFPGSRRVERVLENGDCSKRKVWEGSEVHIRGPREGKAICRGTLRTFAGAVSYSRHVLRHAARYLLASVLVAPPIRARGILGSFPVGDTSRSLCNGMQILDVTGEGQVIACR